MSKRELLKEIVGGVVAVAVIAGIFFFLFWMATHRADKPPAVLVKCPACGAEVEVELKKKGGG